MTDEQDRERESRESSETKYEQLADEVERDQQRVARELATDPIVNEPDRGES